jgi:hypothetical protein
MAFRRHRMIDDPDIFRAARLLMRPLTALLARHVWANDFVEGRTRDGHKFRMLTIIDEFTRECLEIEAARRLRSDDVLHRLAELFRERGPPDHIRSDNGTPIETLIYLLPNAVVGKVCHPISLGGSTRSDFCALQTLQGFINWHGAALMAHDPGKLGWLARTGHQEPERQLPVGSNHAPHVPGNAVDYWRGTLASMRGNGGRVGEPGTTVAVPCRWLPEAECGGN